MTDLKMRILSHLMPKQAFGQVQYFYRQDGWRVAVVIAIDELWKPVKFRLHHWADQTDKSDA